jgi:16S rRNA processing protein RimM
VNSTAGQERFVALARVVKAHGVRGELRLKLFNPDSGVLTRRPRVRLSMPDGELRSAELESVREVPGGLLARLRGVSDRDQAEALRGALLEVPRAELAPLDDDEFYFSDLEGCAVMLGRETLGRVTTVVSYPTCDALVVERIGSKPLEVPLHETYVGSIDLDGGRIELLTIDELE